MVERSLIALALIAAGLGVYLALTRWQLRRAARRTRPPGLEALQPDRPAILYFTAPGCVPCRTVQMPALAALQAEMGAALQVIQIDAVRRPDAADFWGVLSAPTTFVLDRRGRARRVNHGVAGAARLRGQLEEIGALPQAAPVSRAARAGRPEAG